MRKGVREYLFGSSLLYPALCQHLAHDLGFFPNNQINEYMKLWLKPHFFYNSFLNHPPCSPTLVDFSTCFLVPHWVPVIKHDKQSHWTSFWFLNEPTLHIASRPSHMLITPTGTLLSSLSQMIQLTWLGSVNVTEWIKNLLQPFPPSLGRWEETCFYLLKPTPFNVKNTLGRGSSKMTYYWPQNHTLPLKILQI